MACPTWAIEVTYQYYIQVYLPLCARFMTFGAQLSASSFETFFYVYESLCACFMYCPQQDKGRTLDPQSYLTDEFMTSHERWEPNPGVLQE